uniref:Secreted protein n=1 Tax=Picea glauca TaxID=3330 RepID=A0A101M3G7_PICGL|nr:hypothetical protein ABT39_MTgene57 [Picea glauca]
MFLSFFLSCALAYLIPLCFFSLSTPNPALFVLSTRAGRSVIYSLHTPHDQVLNLALFYSFSPRSNQRCVIQFVYYPPHLSMCFRTLVPSGLAVSVSVARYKQ